APSDRPATLPVGFHEASEGRARSVRREPRQATRTLWFPCADRRCLNSPNEQYVGKAVNDISRPGSPLIEFGGDLLYDRRQPVFAVAPTSPDVDHGGRIESSGL